MTSLLSTPGKYRSRKEWSTNSIPTLVSLEEEVNTMIPYKNGTNNNFIDVNDSVIRKYSDSNVPSTKKTIFEDEADEEKSKIDSAPEPKTSVSSKSGKSSRRSSLGLSLLSGRRDSTSSSNSKQGNKRRSSIAGAFLGRRDNKRKDSNGQTEKYQRKTESSDIENDPPTITISEDYDTKEKKPRRSSWQAKLERRRRKESPSISDADIVEFNTNGANYLDQINRFEYRQKRHSWWNIFVPENLKNRSRRSSQDIGIPSADGNGIADKLPYRRSKSRSVDHGLAAPFDLDSLRSKVEGRFESIDRLSAKGAQTPTPTISYTVGDRDTLTSVAARFDTTPSELTQLNRLGSSFIYSGQTLLVPDKSKMNDEDNSSETSADTDTDKDKTRKSSTNDDIPQEEKDLLDDLRPSSPKPGRIERVVTPNANISSDPNAAQSSTNEDDPVTIQRFLKINVRHITDGQGVVGGVLLVTPNAVMFDPNVSDPLVIEHGPESYGVIAPMEFIVNAAIFNDIAHMRVGSVEHHPTSTQEKPEVYHPKPPCNRCDTHSPGKDSLLVKDETFPELGVGSVDQESNCSSTERDGDAFPKAFERELVTPNNLERLHADSTESTGKDDATKKDDPEAQAAKSLEDRRKSLLDHHWAIPSKDRNKCKCDNTIKRSDEEDEDDGKKTSENKEDAEKGRDILVEGLGPDNKDDGSSLSKASCHDSGIDIRDALPIPQVPVIPTKKVYSDADIVLSSDWVPPLTLAPPSHSTDSKSQTSSLIGQDTVPTASDSGRKKTSSVSFSVEENSESSQGSNEKSGENKKNKMLKRLSYPLAWVEGLTGEGSGTPKETDSAPNTSDSTQSVFSKVFSRRSSIGTFIRSHPSTDSSTSSQSSKKPAPPKLDYRSMVSIDDMPALFVSFDKLIPRPARACPDPPMYLRLRMGRQIGKNTALPTTVMSYGKNKLRPEYWFSIPKNKVDELYRFLNAWVQHLYGELDEEAIKSRGFELIQHDTEWSNNRSSSKDGGEITEEISEYTRESWEVLSMSKDDYRKATLFSGSSFDQEFQIPDLVGQTEILSEEHREKLCSHLPARAEGYSWHLVFSTSLHGFSLNSLYRKMHKLESPILIVIQDTDQNVFGALTSCSLHVSDHFYGTGESLLYKFNPSFKVFHWSGENLYFIKGDPESLAVGAGDGKFGLWLDGDLNQGRSQKCSTYSNEPLAPQEDFVIKTLECWAFV